MSLLYLIARELRHRPVASLLAVAALIVAVALPIAFFTAGDSSNRETRRLMRDIGYNLRIVPAATDMEAYWRDGYSQATFPDDAVQRFAGRKGIAYNHLIAMLQRRVKWRGKSVLLTGIAEELIPPGKARGSMIFAVRPGTLVLGHAIAQRIQCPPGERVELLGRNFEVADRLSESGSVEDVRVYAHLSDAQELLGEPGAVNEIKALECGCVMGTANPVEQLRAELARILPEGKVIRMDSIADARSEQRLMGERYFALVLGFTLVFCGMWVAFLAMLNVRARRYEVGILRALGHGSARIAGLFLGKFALLGLVAGAAGFALGSGVALMFGPEVFTTRAGEIRVAWSLLLPALLLAPLFAASAAFVPAVLATTRDPAATLQEADQP